MSDALGTLGWVDWALLAVLVPTAPVPFGGGLLYVPRAAAVA